jgi:dTDP-4-amino-4,6-dideoxygalactose transaminase
MPCTWLWYWQGVGKDDEVIAMANAIRHQSAYLQHRHHRHKAHVCLSNPKTITLIGGSMWCIFCLLVLLGEGILTRSGVMTIYRETAYRKYCADVSLPASEDVYDRSIILPLYAQTTQEEVSYVIRTFKNVLEI